MGSREKGPHVTGSRGAKLELDWDGAKTKTEGISLKFHIPGQVMWEHFKGRKYWKGCQVTGP